MDIWFVRHAESTVNAGMPSIYTETVEITEKGVAQARLFAAGLPRKPDIIAVTPFLRTQQTAQPTQARFPDVPVAVLPLQEFMPIAFAHYAHKTSAERKPLQKAYWERRDVDYVDGEGAESFAQQVQRIRLSLQSLKETPGDFKVVFTHGRILQTLHAMLAFPDLDMKQLMRLSSEMTLRDSIENCAVFKTRLDGNGVLHLADEDRAFVARMRAEIEAAPSQARGPIQKNAAPRL
jgi:broad specificity phosphatase PhoE